ncbi:uncharacterized protein LOC129227493 [Uloborus diversus]|uniref:uncharacterized protein LOC129227493 n=1 Tax=Uloborus diversus TaxID=327109 RepID=UPI002409083A|nr:uncharacterized protein LOC129227493 [Uloborus diversus]XP_054718042.1 uncharacterized protein LOC129227493 [Uloborus diversus]XP_054718043.1 uncharacterized protein LOC129227493 [Uloborus diversus]
MNIERQFFLCVLLGSSLVHIARCLDYSDLEGFGLNCPNRFSCSLISNRQSFGSRNCECDPACVAYDDCCIDAKPLVRRRQRPRPVNNKRLCLPYGGYKTLGVYVVNQCARGWDGPPEVLFKCRGPMDLRDPLNAVPLTSVSQGRTYRNRYCAECNGGNPSDLLTWRIHLDCENLPLNVSNSNVWENLEWSETTEQWGVYRWNRNRGERTFYPCMLVFDIPPSATTSVRHCRAGMISTCKRDWTRESVRKACESYMAAVYTGSESYRNPHCAVCNHLTLDKFSCEEGLTSRKRPLSFALLLDVNGEGDQVGVSRQVTPRCPSGEMYDPFFKKCRELVCALPGYRMRNGKCQPP